MKLVSAREISPNDDGDILVTSGGMTSWVPAASLIGSSAFKGAWQATPDELVWEQDFDTDILPFTGPGVQTSMAAAVGTSKPAGYAWTNQGQGTPSAGGNVTTQSLDLSDIDDLSGRIVTRLKLWNGESSTGTLSAASRDLACDILRNGSVVYTSATMHTVGTATTSLAWSERELAAANDDLFIARVRGVDGNSSGRPIGKLALTGVRIYAVVIGWEGYSVDDHVVYLGQIYRSVVDDNNSTPGTNADWVLVPIYRTAKVPNAQAAAYVLTSTDADATVIVTNAGAVALTIPSDATTNFPIGTRIAFIQGGAGVVTATAAAGVTLNGSGATTAQWNRRWLEKTAANTWVCTN